MKKILVPVDFSTHTAASCRFAAYLAHQIKAEVILFHSFLNQVFYTSGGLAAGFEAGIMLTDEMMLDFFKQKETLLQKLTRETLDYPKKSGFADLPVTYKIESGDPEVQILQAIETLKADLVIMGSAGMGKKGLLSGSVARRIMVHSKVPVIAVPGMENIPDIRNIAYMTNFDPGDHQAILKADALLAGMDIEIHLTHLTEADQHNHAHEKLRQLFENQYLRVVGSNIKHHVIASGDLNQSLNDFIQQNSITMLAFIPHKRNILKNLLYKGITKEDLFLTNLPLMAIPSSHKS